MIYMADGGNRTQAITEGRRRRVGIVSVVLDTPVVPCAMMRLQRYVLGRERRTDTI